MYLVCFFFFKQKTAYEMRISDWSSDVCSSDLRRVIRSVEREPDGTWIIAADHLDKAAAFEARQRRDRPVTIETLSAVSLDRLPHTDAATWLDKELVAGAPEPIRAAGFGREVRAAQSLRGQWLIADGLADEIGRAHVCTPVTNAHLV